MDVYERKCSVQINPGLKINQKKGCFRMTIIIAAAGLLALLFAVYLSMSVLKEEIGNGMPITIGGIIESVRPVITKNNDRMAFLKISDLTDSIEAVAFPKIFQKSIETFVPEKCIALSGKVSLRNGEKSIIIEGVKEI